MRFEDLTPEQAEMARGCETPEEVLALVAEEGVELTDEQLEGVAGGAWGDGDVCPSGKGDHKYVRTGRKQYYPSTEYEMRCEYCGNEKWVSYK